MMLRQYNNERFENLI